MLPALVEPLPEIRVGPGIFVGPIPHPRPCMAAQCGVPAVAHVMWLSSDWTRLEYPEVCLGHAEVCREMGGCILVPLGMMPPEHVLVAAIEAEIRRRRAQVYQMQQTVVVNFGFSNQTAYGTKANGFFQWG